MTHHMITKVIVLIGALNWGLVGITNLFGTHFDLVEYIGYDLLRAPIVAHLIYTVVGIAALVMVVGMLNRS